MHCVAVPPTLLQGLGSHNAASWEIDEGVGEQRHCNGGGWAMAPASCTQRTDVLVRAVVLTLLLPRDEHGILGHAVVQVRRWAGVGGSSCRAGWMSVQVGGKAARHFAAAFLIGTHT